MSNPSLDRIINQIKEHKGELTKPENSMQSFIDSSLSKAPAKPVEDIREFLSDEQLDSREKFLKEQEAVVAPPEKEEEEDHYEKLVEEANLSPPEEVEEYLNSEKEEYTFNSVYDLRDFFQKHKGDFEDWAHPAIDSVLAAVKSITSGCKCKLDQRKNMVEDYYKNFILQNQHTSLIEKIKELLKTKKIKFYSREELFLEV